MTAEFLFYSSPRRLKIIAIVANLFVQSQELKNDRKNRLRWWVQLFTWESSKALLGSACTWARNTLFVI